MSLLLSKNNVPSYQYYSQGTELTPVTVTVDLDATGGTVTDVSDSPVYAIATTWNYTDISITFINEEVGINWELSTNNTTWAEAIILSNMDALLTDQSTLIYARATFVNDGSIATGKHTTPDIRITSIERPI